MPDSSERRHPLFTLGNEDLEFVLRLVLASGSLKALAEGYEVSYPTIRARLDGIIARLTAAVAGRKPEPMAGLLADLVDRGELSASAAKAVLKLYQQETRRAKESG